MGVVTRLHWWRFCNALSVLCKSLCARCSARYKFRNLFSTSFFLGANHKHEWFTYSIEIAILHHGSCYGCPSISCVCQVRKAFMSFEASQARMQQMNRRQRTTFCGAILNLTCRALDEFQIRQRWHQHTTVCFNGQHTRLAYCRLFRNTQNCCRWCKPWQ